MNRHPPSAGNRYDGSSPHFDYRVDSDGCDQVIDIISKQTGEIVARLPFWEEYEATRDDALLLIVALDRFMERGGFLQASAMKTALACEINVYSGTGKSLGTITREDD